MTPDEKRAYGKGYAAGRRRHETDRAEREARMTRNEFYNEALLRLLPTAFTVQGWTSGGTPITSGRQRASLAASWADDVTRHMR